MTLRRTAQAVLAGLLTAGFLATGGLPAAGKGGEIGGIGNLYLFSNDFGAVANREAVYGKHTDRVLVGNWDGDGVDTLAVRRGREYHFKNSLSGGAADAVVLYGRAEDTVLVGDWDGDGVDTLAVRRGREYHLKNALGGGAADRVVLYGRAEDAILVGDWNGDRVASLAVRRSPEGSAAPQPNPPVLAYGTLRSGQSGHGVVGRTVKEAPGRAPGLDLYMISGYSFPWAVPNSANTAGITGEIFWFHASTYWSDIARLDRYERYDPSKPASGQLYTRELRATSHPGVSAWVYVATPRWASIARDRGTRIPSGDYLRW